MKQKVLGMTIALSVVTATMPLFASAASTPIPTVKTNTLLPGYSWTSPTWAGYAETGSGYNDITGQWVVPSVSATSSASSSSFLIGIDGFNNSDMIQIGTEQDYSSGAAHYDAWWEILPAAETVIPSIAVHPGDTMYAHLHNNGGGIWNLYLQDVTTGASYSINQSYSGPCKSAEWLLQGPSSGTLAHFSTITMDPGTLNGGNPGLTASMAGAMTNSSGTVIAAPSVPDADTDGFAVGFGSTRPSAPTS